MSKTKPSLPRGMRDFGPKVAAKRNYIIEKIKANFTKYGFSQIQTSAIENLSVLTGKYGDEGDQLLFKILSSGDFLNKTHRNDYELGSKHFTSKISDKGLRYDLTVPFARFVVMNQNDITFPFKRFQIQQVWRADRPQRGRYREFQQCDADIIGSKGLWSEIELTLLFKDVFKDLGLENYIIKINHREILFFLAKYIGLEEKTIAFCAEIDKLDKIGEDKTKENVLGIGADKKKLEEVMEILSLNERDKIIHQLKAISSTSKGLKQVIQYFQSLDDLDATIKVELDISLARGLSYYTGMIFEVKPTNVKIGSICGGGRYDDLIGMFGLPGVSGIGISFGLDRIFDVMEELHLFPAKISQRLDILILHFSQDNLNHGHKIVTQLRNEGIKADLFPESVKIRKQFDYADKVETPYSLIIGDNEMISGAYMFKNMQTGEQKHMTLNEIINLFKG
ncbi:MAG: histidine--tRNA ligase [Bacteroidota bacterium]